MTKSVTLAWLPRAAAISKPHHYKQKARKMKDLAKTWDSGAKSFADFRQKEKTETFFSTFQKTQLKSRTLNMSIEQGPRKQQDLNQTKLDRKQSV